MSGRRTAWPVFDEARPSRVSISIAGFWLIQVKSKEEAIEWARRVPFQEGEVEIHQVFEAEDFGEAFTPELREQEERLRAQLDAQG